MIMQFRHRWAACCGDTGGPADTDGSRRCRPRSASCSRRPATARRSRTRFSILQLAWVRHRADQDFPRSRRRAGRGQRLREGAGRKVLVVAWFRWQRRYGSRCQGNCTTGQLSPACSLGPLPVQNSFLDFAPRPRLISRRAPPGASRIEAYMRIGVPRELKNHQYRWRSPRRACTNWPRGPRGLRRERRGAGPSLPDEEFTAAAPGPEAADDVWARRTWCSRSRSRARGDHRMRQGQCCSRTCTWPRPGVTDALLSLASRRSRTRPCSSHDGSLPLLAPMSEVARRMAPPVGAHHLQRDGGGRGVLMGGVSGVYAAKVVVLGAGVSGMDAAAIALGMQAEVLLLDRNVARLRSADAIYQGHLQTVTSNSYEVERAVIDADLVIGAVPVPGAKAPRLVSHKLVTRIKQGSVLMDISIDQGGCFEDSRPTTHAEPTYRVADSVFYCVANMPGVGAATRRTRSPTSRSVRRGDRRPRLTRRHARRRRPCPGPGHLRGRCHLPPGRRDARPALHPGGGTSSAHDLTRGVAGLCAGR